MTALSVSGLACAHAQPPPPVVDSDPDPPASTTTIAAPPPPADTSKSASDTPAFSTAERAIALRKAKAYPYPVAILPGFEMRADGGSRLFVEVTKNVDVEERRAARVLTYVLKGTRVVYRNNENALVTVHFNTPVTRARLFPSGKDLTFTVDLRADATPTWKMIPESDGTAMLQVDFPQGSFLPADGHVDEAVYPTPTGRGSIVLPGPPATSAAPLNTGSRGMGRGGGRSSGGHAAPPVVTGNPAPGPAPTGPASPSAN
jgi:hypothetical protein